ncbi:MAG: DUF885 domain-containing protein [Acidimicrobiia bacterium]|nr:DUF885 domain-containing protein [Acidimicrobiia bacterium]
MNADLTDLAEQYWQDELANQPTQALMLGIHDYDHLMEDASREHEDARISKLRSYVARAAALDEADLEPDERITRDVMMFEAGTSADILEMRAAELDVNHIAGTPAILPILFPQFPIDEPEHAAAMLEKYAAMAPWFDQMTDRLRAGVAAGRTPMASTVQATIAQIDDQLSASPDASVFMNVQSPAQYGEAETAAWRDQLSAIVRDNVYPAYRRYRDYISDHVLPASRDEDHPGVCHLEGGDEWYRRALKRHTSVDLTAEEIHDIGLGQIAKLDDEYRQLGSEVLGTTDLAEIYRQLRDDPALRFDNGEQVRAASEVALAKAKEAMADWFGRLPKADCLVEETPTGPTAFYMPPATDGSRPGKFYVNTSDPDAWKRYEMEALAYHEGIPGHHLQLAIAGELDGIPEFRKHAMITVYAEGWGLYTERLADEMGLYSGPLERIGMLSADSMRAGRLVVDTGIHAKGWTRQQAIDFMADNSPLSLGTIEPEIDRYIGWPGQATAYMIGRLEMVRMRAEAETAMRDRFDIKGFHDTVLCSGLVPLGTLDRMVKEWVAAA